MVQILSLALALPLFLLLSQANAQPAAGANLNQAGVAAQGNEADTAIITPGVEFDAVSPIPDPVPFCLQAGKVTQNNSQLTGGSCSSTPIGRVMPQDRFPATLIIAPKEGDILVRDQEFTTIIQIDNFQAGFFDDATFNYYAVPFTTNAQGILQGHSHITVQNLGNAQNAPDANVKEFFKGLNDAPDAQGRLQDVIEANTLIAGTNRFCTILGGRGHASPALSLIERGSFEDCRRVQVVNNQAEKDALEAAQQQPAQPAPQPAEPAQPAPQPAPQPEQPAQQTGGLRTPRTPTRRPRGRRSLLA